MNKINIHFLDIFGGNSKTRIRILSKENRFCFLDTRDFIESANEIQPDTKILNDSNEFNLEQLEKDASTVEDTLQKKIDWWTPLWLSMSSNDDILERTTAENKAIFDDFYDFRNGVRVKINALTENSQKEYQRLVKGELILDEVIQRMEKEKQDAIARKQALLDAMENLRKTRFIKVPNPKSVMERWKIESHEMKGAEKQKKKLEVQKARITKKREKYEKAIEAKLAPYANLKDNLINFFEIGGFEKEDAEKIIEAVASGDLVINENWNQVLSWTEEPYASMITDDFWKNLGKTERKVLRTILTKYEKDKNREKLHDLRVQKHNIEKLREYKTQHLEYTKIAKGQEVKLPSLKVGNETFEPGKYLIIKKAQGKHYFLRIDDNSNDENDLKKDLIVLDKEKWGWEFAGTNSRTKLALGWKIDASIQQQIIQSQKLEKRKAKLEKDIKILRDNLDKFQDVTSMKAAIKTKVKDYKSFLAFLGTGFWTDAKHKIDSDLVDQLNHLDES